MAMRGYKAFDENMTCLGNFQYEVGKTYEMSEPPRACRQGFHFCKTIAECFTYYPIESSIICEVEAYGDIDVHKSEGATKYCTNKIKILKRVSDKRIRMATSLAGPGRNSNGRFNLFQGNSGNCNVGAYNNGSFNTSSHNLGYRNTGSHNIGASNSGSRNVGWQNTGCTNRGDYNTGCNNVGNGNVGSYNVGNRNLGDFNVGSGCTGCFNIASDIDERKISLFNKESDWTLNDWLQSQARAILSTMPDQSMPTTSWVPIGEMTAEEKAVYPNYQITGGYLRVNRESDAVTIRCRRQTWWNRDLTERQRRTIMALPNFDAKIFEKITGIHTYM